MSEVSLCDVDVIGRAIYQFCSRTPEDRANRAPQLEGDDQRKAPSSPEVTGCQICQSEDVEVEASIAVAGTGPNDER